MIMAAGLFGESFLTATRTDGFSSETIVAGLDDVTFMEFVLDNNDVGDVNTTSITVEIDDSFPEASIGNPQNYTAAIFVDGTQQGSSKNFSATTNTAVFNDLSVVIPSDGQREFAVVVNTSEVSSGDVLRMRITAVDADNVENGQPVSDVYYLPLMGAEFSLIESGSLQMSLHSTVYSDILVAGSDDVEVLKIRFDAVDDEVQVKDIYLNNNSGGWTDFGPRADFKLYDEAGQLVQTKQMQTGDALHFELANQDRIVVPKDGSTFVTIKVDIRDITQAAMTGKRLKLTLDTSEGTGGVEAITSATGVDLAANVITGNFVGEEFIAYRTEMFVEHAAVQPNFMDPSEISQECYRFTVTADVARQAEIGRVTLGMDISGMEFTEDTGDLFQVKLVNPDGTINYSAVVTTSVVDNAELFGSNAIVVVDFENQMFSAGESRTYALFIRATGNVGGEDDDAVCVSIVPDLDYLVPTNRAFLEDYANIIWSDESSNTHSDITNDWENGYLLGNDTTTQVNGDFTSQNLRGDVDMNGFLQPMDASLIFQHWDGFITLSPQQLLLADFNNDGLVDVNDGIDLLWSITGEPPVNPIEAEVNPYIDGDELVFEVVNGELFAFQVIMESENVDFGEDFWVNGGWYFARNGNHIVCAGSMPVIDDEFLAVSLEGSGDLDLEMLVNTDPEHVVITGLRYVPTAVDDSSVSEISFETGNYPNPFNPSTKIAYSLPEDGNVSLEIFNIKGQKVKSLVSDFRTKGSHSVTWNGTDDNQNAVSSGVYFYRITAGKHTKTNKMIMMK